MSRKVVYNDCYGGFGLSPLAVKRYYELKYPDVTLYFYKETYRDDFDEIYETYASLGGNGKGTMMHDNVHRMEIR